MINNISTNWVSFYEELATKLLEYKNNRPEILKKLNEIEENKEKYGIETDSIFPKKDEFGKDYNFEDICPFTVFGIFNRSLDLHDRIGIMNGIKEKFELESEVPTDLTGIPIMYNAIACFVDSKVPDYKEEINRLWLFFESAINFSKNANLSSETIFKNYYNDVVGKDGLNFRYAEALFWIRPMFYLPLDKINRYYIKEKLGIDAPIGKPVNADEYVELARRVKTELKSMNLEITSIPEMSYISHNELKEI